MTATNKNTFRSKGAVIRNYRAKLIANISDALGGLIIVFNNQRDDEIATNSTHHKNFKGFNKPDARILSQIAKDKLDGKDLTEVQLNEVSKRMPKYARQIMNTKFSNGQIVKRNGVYVSLQNNHLHNL